METKICTKCDTELEATLEYWYKQKNGKYGLRSICKMCAYEAQKEYRKNPKIREAHRIEQAEWRAKNPDRAIEINRRCYNKNADRINAKKRERLKTDPVFRAKIREYQCRYRKSGRRYEINSRPENREKARIRSKKRRSDPIKKHHDNERAKQWRADNKIYINESNDKKRKELYNSYVATSMRMSVLDLTPEVIETRRLIIQLKRELKSNNIKIK